MREALLRIVRCWGRQLRALLRRQQGRIAERTTGIRSALVQFLLARALHMRAAELLARSRRARLQQRLLSQIMEQRAFRRRLRRSLLIASPGRLRPQIIILMRWSLRQQIRRRRLVSALRARRRVERRAERGRAQERMQQMAIAVLPVFLVLARSLRRWPILALALMRLACKIFGPLFRVRRLLRVFVRWSRIGLVRRARRIRSRWRRLLIIRSITGR